MDQNEFEAEYFDKSDYYGVEDAAQSPRACAKGRTKRQSQENSNRPVPAGHERKIADKLQRAHHNASHIASGPTSSTTASSTTASSTTASSTTTSSTTSSTAAAAVPSGRRGHAKSTRGDSAVTE
uniref:Nuclear protein 1 n=1 Tax=Petromyzon marinus TaxID=7757 RepID=A0AAJ7UKG6_PETMA|nr:nuclear protein 1 [Petromyzon marinus]